MVSSTHNSAAAVLWAHHSCKKQILLDWQHRDCMQYIPMYTSHQQRYGPEISLCLARCWCASKFDVDLLFMSVVTLPTTSTAENISTLALAVYQWPQASFNYKPWVFQVFCSVSDRAQHQELNKCWAHQKMGLVYMTWCSVFSASADKSRFFMWICPILLLSPFPMANVTAMLCFPCVTGRHSVTISTCCLYIVLIFEGCHFSGPTTSSYELLYSYDRTC